MAIDIANSWHRHSRARTTRDVRDGGDHRDIDCYDRSIRLVSMRGSEILSTCGGHAGAAVELRRTFEDAISWASSCHGMADVLVDDSVNNNDNSTNDRGCDVGGLSLVHRRRRAGGRGRHPRAVVVFLDECDALLSSSTVVAATLAAILDEMDGGGFYTSGNVNDDRDERRVGLERVIVVAATNRVDSIPDFLRRPGRLEREVVVRPPDSDGRFELLRSMLRVGPSMRGRRRDAKEEDEHDDDVDIDEAGLREVADACVGYVAADLSALVRGAATIRIEEAMRTKEIGGTVGDSLRLRITARDLISAMDDVGASCLRDAALSAPPDTKWDDIAGDAGGAKRALREAIEWPRTRRRAFEALGLSPPRGVLLHGPPGCAKTTLARAAAGSAGVAFLSLGPADVYATSYVGDAEAVVRRAFDLARYAAPCVLFFDEIDAIVATDDQGGHGMGRGPSAEARVLSTFLNEMDGVDGSAEDGVLVLGATNRPSTIDAALLRPGRFDRVVYVPPPDEAGRKAILSMECKKWHDALLEYYSHPIAGKNGTTTDAVKSPDLLEKYFNTDILSSDEVSGHMTGAEIVGSCREAAVDVMRTIMIERDFEGDGALLSKTTAERLMQTLMRQLKKTLEGKTPLLSNPAIFEEYTTFERNNNNK
ncbi:hypothetical protein ACHAXA_002279 [Cyclostephanos tholiformis]|uniref:AAA+ ATPase domain-containing protein n=1 Tax=Cyclostephanos tholiformis TaxID=382380 RepID=A0ABD3RDB7_9STRA